MYIRDFVESDKENYISMAKNFYSGDATLYTIDDLKLNRTFEQIIKKSPHVRGLALEENNKVIGYSLITYIWICEAGGLTVWIDELYINKEFRGKGYGSKFITWVFDEHKDENISFRLEICPNNMQVKNLYERYGFKELNYLQMVKDYNI